jgi:hypothetical protein
LVLPVVPAHADTFDYTFSGNGSGSVGGVTFTNQNFTFVLVGNTSAIDAGSPPLFRLNDLGGTFTEGGSTETLTPTVTIVVNSEFPTAPSSVGSVNIFNSTFDNGVGIIAAALNGYGLSTAIGPVSGSFNATLNGGSFGSNGGLISITGQNSLTFTAGPVGAPEPTSLALLGIGVAGLIFLRRGLGSVA